MLQLKPGITKQVKKYIYFLNVQLAAVTIFCLELTGLILLSKGLSGIFSSTTLTSTNE